MAEFGNATGLQTGLQTRLQGREAVYTRRGATGDTGEMGHRPDPPAVIWLNAPEAFGFLCEKWGFEGPDRISGGVAYHRVGLHITIEFLYWKHEAEFVTRLSMVDPTGRVMRASLGCLYLACGLGTAQAVPTSAAGAGHTIAKRAGQHAAALLRVMPHLDGSGAVELFRRCERRDLPVT